MCLMLVGLFKFILVPRLFHQVLEVRRQKGEGERSGRSRRGKKRGEKEEGERGRKEKEEKKNNLMAYRKDSWTIAIYSLLYLYTTCLWP